MRFDIHLRATVREQIQQVTETMKSWEEQPRMDDHEKNRVRANLAFFPHTIQRQKLRIAGADGSGDFPAVSYADSFIYISVAYGAVYEADSVSGLREVGPAPDPLFYIAWVPEETSARKRALDDAFVHLAGSSIEEVVNGSDYVLLKNSATRRQHSTYQLAADLIRPHAADAGNIGIQLRSSAELGAIRSLILHSENLTYALIDGTLSLPMVDRSHLSLFHEHLKRLCCVEARNRGIGFFALSKSHGLPAMEVLEELAQESAHLESGESAEHWYLRMPVPTIDDWRLSLAEGRRLPPAGAISYLVRFHRTTPVMRLDMDEIFWRNHVLGMTDDETRSNEQRILADLDYAGHDQRCYGYPYPLKAGHDRASLTKAERIALRKQIIDAALKAGMKRSLFRDASQATGHA